MRTRADTTVENFVPGLVLSLFPGIDLLGRGFELEGWCVVRGPDIVFGQDITSFVPMAAAFEGIIGGSPCQDFSTLRRCPPTGEGERLLKEYLRCVEQARPDWFLLENVPGVPDIQLDGYKVQRFDLRASECGLQHRRLRHFQFGSRRGFVLLLERNNRSTEIAMTPLASEHSRACRRGFEDFCRLMGLAAAVELPSFTRSAKYKAVGNAVPLPMARYLASVIRDRQVTASSVRLCACNCGRPVTGKQVSATPACRKRLSRGRRCPRRIVTLPARDFSCTRVGGGLA